MTYPKHIEAEERQKASKLVWQTAAKNYLAAESFDEFQIKCAAEGIKDEDLLRMFKFYYVLHNNETASADRGIKLRAFSFGVICTLVVAMAVSAFLCALSISLWYVLYTLIVFPISIKVASIFMECCLNLIDNELRNARY